jgi:DNA-binding beta-propeller fold protein YncE
VQRFTAGGAFLSSFGATGSGPGQLSSPTGVAVDGNGFVVVMDAGNGRVEAFREDGSYVLAFGSEGPLPGQFFHPAAIDIDPQGRIVVLDKDNSRVQVFANLATPARRETWGVLKARFR